MELIASNKHTKERKIAEVIVSKLKSTAAAFESKDPTHRNGIKYTISKKVYDNTINMEFDNRRISHVDRMVITQFINRRLRAI
jgi:hypothetical protein